MVMVGACNVAVCHSKASVAGRSLDIGDDRCGPGAA